MAKHTFTCAYCGAKVDLDLFRHNNALVDIMRANQLCFDCAFWNNTLVSRKPGSYIVSGKLYSFQFLERVTQRKLNSHPETLFVRNMGTGEVYASIDYLYKGTLPSHIAKAHPDEYKFISRHSFETISAFEGNSCYAKGCFDRYHCFFYNPALAEPDGPWNEIPSTHKVGDEKCVSFIDKSKIYDND